MSMQSLDEQVDCFGLTRKRDSKIRASRAVDSRTAWESRKKGSMSVLFYESSRNVVLTCTWLAFRVRVPHYCSMLRSNLATLIPTSVYDFFQSPIVFNAQFNGA